MKPKYFLSTPEGGLALQAILSNNAAFTKHAEDYAKQAIAHTDALLKELEK